MAVADYFDTVQKIYIAFYQRPADPAGLQYWAGQADAAGAIEPVLDAFAASEEAQNLYGAINESTIGDVIDAIYQALFNRAPDADGKQWYIAEFEAGNITAAGIMYAVLVGAQNEDLDNVNAKVAAADLFTATVADAEVIYDADDEQAARDWLADVSAASAPSAAQVEAFVQNDIGGNDPVDPVDPEEPTEGATIRLTLDQDVYEGTAGDDTFIAMPIRGWDTFDTGVIIDGGAGRDTLDITLGDTSTYAILAETTGVEVVSVRSQASNIGGNSGNNDIGVIGLDGMIAGTGVIDGNRNVIDAELMQGVQEWWSSNSRADLVVEDVRTNSHLTTLGFRNADPGDVDYAVFFDPQNITRPGDGGTGSQLVVKLADVLGLAEDDNGLAGLPFSGLTLDIGGESVLLSIDFSALTSYADLANALRAALASEGHGDVTVRLLPEEEAVFSISVTSNGVTYPIGTQAGFYNPIEFVAPAGVEIGLLDFPRPEGSAPPSGNIVNTFETEAGLDIPSLTQTDIILENVGRGSMSGDFLAGSMSTGLSGSRGIEQFNVEVRGTENQASWIKTLSSTNNTLEVVIARNIGDNEAGLRIRDNGQQINTNAINYGLNDVRVFDATEMVGDVQVTARLGGAVVGKYMDLTDINGDPAADNSDPQQYYDVKGNKLIPTDFNYAFGSGDDTLVLDIDAANLAFRGTTTREDFELTVDGGAGNDEIMVRVVSSGQMQTLVDGNGLAYASLGPFSTEELLANWYDNNKLLQNLVINGGAGDDTIRTPGSGDFIIDGGAGDDTIYTDNTGVNAIWAFNVERGVAFAREQLGNLQSDENNSYQLFGAQMVVSFLGFENVQIDGVTDLTVTVPSTNGFTSDLQINQAIKNAINNHDVLSKLLVAQDGPANTLIVTSLIDGAMAADSLSISLELPESLSNAQVNQLNGWYGTPGATAADHMTTFAASIAAFNAEADYTAALGADDGGVLFNGTNSLHTSDSTIIGGTDNDVIVLSTGRMSNETVVYEGFGNGTDSIVNFDTNYTETETLVAVPGSPEAFTVTFGDLTVPDQTLAVSLEFDGVPVAFDNGTITANLVPGADIAYAFADAYVNPNWTVAYVPGTNQVTFIAAANGNITNVLPADFAFTNATGSVSLSDYVEGVDDYAAAQDAVATVFTVDFAGTIVNEATNADFTFDGQAIDLDLGDGPITAAAKVAAGTYANWTAVDNLDGTVTFTAVTAGVLAAPVAADFINDPTAGVSAAVSVDTVGADAVPESGTATTVVTAAGAALDYLDFSDYNAAAVVVDGVTLAGALTVENQLYVQLVEAADNAGEYQITLWDAKGTEADVQLGLIGVADFGQTMDFVEQNFII